MRWLAVDHGHVRIGIASGDTTTGIAAPLTVLPAGPTARLAQEIARLATEHGAKGVVVGWPLNMDDTEGPQGKLVRQFALELAQATGLDVRLWDERLSSFQADQALAGQFTRNKRRARQDAVAAACILQDFLSCDGPDAAPTPDQAI